MRKILLACDLDNTLIHSYKHFVDGDICIEHLNGNEQGFMHPLTYKGLQELPAGIALVPLTSRSVGQYRRVRWPENKAPYNALTTNGCILLQEDREVPSWIEQSARLLEPFLAEFDRVQALLSKEAGIERCGMVDGMYLFARFASEVQAKSAAERIRPTSRMEVAQVQRKLYVIAPGTSKGAAIKRLKEAPDFDLLICAGDSEADLSMLREADVAVVPNRALANGLRSGVKTEICREGARFSDFILEVAHKYMAL